MNDRPIRIAIYHATLPGMRGKKGGVEASVHRIANSLARRDDCEVTVFSSGKAPDDSLYRHRNVFDGTNARRITRLLVSPFRLNGVDFSEFDLVHFHGDDWFFVRRGLPTVRTFHGSALGEARSATSLKRRLSMYLVYGLERISAKLADATVAVNETTRALYGSDTVIGNGVNTELFKPLEKTVTPSLSFVGTWEGRKRGQFLFREFVERILPRVPDCHLTMISDRCDAHPSVTHVTDASDQDVATTIGESWIFSYPSTYEGFGIPYIEAMAAGAVVVSTPNGGADFVLSNGKYGAFASDDAFADTVVELIEDASRRESYRQAGFARAEEFSDATIAQAHVDIYRAALNGS